MGRCVGRLCALHWPGPQSTLSDPVLPHLSTFRIINPSCSAVSTCLSFPRPQSAASAYPRQPRFPSTVPPARLPGATPSVTICQGNLLGIPFALFCHP